MPDTLRFNDHASEPRVLQPHSLLPEQFFHSFRTRTASRMGEYRLLVAVLEEAIRCFQQNAFASGTRQRRLFLEVEEWIMRGDDASVGDTAAPRFSFEYICAVLDLDAAWLREGLRRWHAARHGSPRSRE